MNKTDLKNDAVENFLSLASLRAAHSALLKRHRQEGDTSELLTEAGAFIRRGRASGAWLDVEDERWASQGLLDYWSTLLYRAGQEPPDSTLAEFAPGNAPQVEQCPFLGLDAFQEAQQSFFFGRRRLIGEMVHKLHGNRLLSVVGPSGSGKSSLVRAGLISALKAGAAPGSRNWRYVPPMVPGSEPLANLARALRPSRVDAHDWDRVQIECFQKNPRHLAQALETLYQSPTVLVVDQFEELFTLCQDDGARRAFVDNLIHLLQAPDNEHTVIITMRVDFEPYMARLPDFQPLFEGAQVRVTPLSAGELREAIERPAELVGLKFEAGVVDALVQDILGEPAALPLLQFTLLKLWEARQRNQVTWEAYRRLGGGRQALASSADEFYAGLIHEEQVTARRILLRMVRPGEGLEVTSNRVRRESLYQAGEARDRIERVLDKLIAARLVRLTEGDTPADAQVEVAHEALVRNWPRLVAWLEDERETMRHRLRLTAAAEQWAALGRDPEALRRGALLDEALRFQDLNELENEFVQASQTAVQQAEREKEAIRQRELEQARALAEEQWLRAEEQTLAARRLRQRAVLQRILIVLMVVVAAIAVMQGSRAQEARDDALLQLSIATSRRLAIQAINQLNFDSDLGLLLAIEALNSEYTIEANDALRHALGALNVQTVLHDQGPVNSVAFDSNANLLAAGNDDGAARLWDVSTLLSDDEVLDVLLHGYADAVRSVAFSADGSLMASGANDGLVYVWDVAALLDGDVGGARRAVLGGIESPILDVAFGANGNLLAAGAENGATHVWQVSTALRTGGSEAEVAVLPGSDTAVFGVAFSPDGKLLATHSDDGMIRLWDVPVALSTGGKGARKITWGAGPPIRSRLAYSPDGSLLASGSEDGALYLWDVSQAFEVEDVQRIELRGHAGAVVAVAFDPHGNWLASASDDGTARLWDVALARRGDGAEVAVLHGHDGPVSSVAFNADGSLLFSGGSDMTVRVWIVDLQNLLSLACDYATRNMRQAEWETFLDEPYRQTCPNLPIHPSVALEYARQGEVDTALSMLREAAALDPSLDPEVLVAVVLVEQGREYARQGELDEAMAAFERAVELDPARKTVVALTLVELGRELARQNEPEKALDIMRQALLIDPSLDLDPNVEAARAMVEQVQFYVHQGEYDVALDLARRAVKLDPALGLDPEEQVAGALAWQAQEYARQGAFDEALDSWKQAIEINPALDLVPEAQVARARGQGLARAGNWEEARAALRRAAELDPRVVPEAELAILQGEEQARRGEVDEALATLRGAAQLDPAYGLNPEMTVAEILFEQASAYVYAHAFEAAVQALGRAAELYPQIERERIWTYYETCRWGSLDEQAEVVLPACDRAVQLEPENGDYYNQRGLARALTGDYEGAIADFEVYLEWGQSEQPQDRLDKRQEWIEQLQAGESPFDQATLEELRGE